MNQSGQEFIGFKMLIGAIIALFILIIILSSIDYFDSLQSNISNKTIAEGFVSATNSPNGDILVKEDLALQAGGYSKRFFSNYAGIPIECITLQSVDYPDMHLSSSEDSLIVKERLVSTVYFQCVTETASLDCDMQCLISFGLPIRD